MKYTGKKKKPPLLTRTENRASNARRGFNSVHATPMRLRGGVLGALNVFSIHMGELGAADVAVAQALADVATIGMLQERSIRERVSLRSSCNTPSIPEF